MHRRGNENNGGGVGLGTTQQCLIWRRSVVQLRSGDVRYSVEGEEKREMGGWVGRGLVYKINI